MTATDAARQAAFREALEAFAENPAGIGGWLWQRYDATVKGPEQCRAVLDHEGTHRCRRQAGHHRPIALHLSDPLDGPTYRWVDEAGGASYLEETG